jgi:hypothetical protein
MELNYNYFCGNVALLDNISSLNIISYINMYILVEIVGT